MMQQWYSQSTHIQTNQCMDLEKKSTDEVGSSVYINGD